ncbi:MAG TPA: amylo-alpha-1,6-glucosidase [Candidatus Saccharimonadales bacterium]|nr:amylo-alpha-1,6-glucosidase [Candidatus Saccharimonadales bacterium]
MEAWVYPLKLLRDLHLVFHEAGRDIPGEALARSIEVKPESTSILYADDTFQVRETFFVPAKESGAVILIDVDTEQPLDIEVAFIRDFQLMWPAAIGGTYLEAFADSRGFLFGEESRRFAGMIGSPTATNLRQEYETNYSTAAESSLRLGSIAKGRDRRVVVLAGSTHGREDAAKTYQKLATSYEPLLRESAEYYRDYLGQTVNAELPDPDLQQAYDWSRISTIQGLVKNPDLGAGLIAGYRTSGLGQRPGFAWFFGRDSLWSSLALNASGDFTTTKTALAFIGKFQREDGKIPHEISQAAPYVNWFKDFPYGFASADATPLYIIAMDDYLQQSGDTDFVKEKWDSIWKAYEFLRSTSDARGFPKNQGIGHGWVEGGPLLPVKTEFYQTGLGTEALIALADLAAATGQDEKVDELKRIYSQQRAKLNDAFWLAEKNRYAFALDSDDKAIDELSVLDTVPMWFGLLDDTKANKTIVQLAEVEHQTDWGMRIISSSSPKYSSQGYHFGSVWPLFTGWASVGEYRYHQAQTAYTNLRSNALLVFDGSLGHVTEVLSGTDYEPLSTSSPQQIWSAAMVVSPLLRGTFGLQRDAKKNNLTFAPHVPADWGWYTLRNVRVGGAQIDLQTRRTAGELVLDVTSADGKPFTLNYAPAISLRAKVAGVDLNGKPLPYNIASNDSDQHVEIQTALNGKANTIRIRMKNDFGVTYHLMLPALGEQSRGLRILTETWSAARDTFTLEYSGAPGASYDLPVWNAKQVTSVEGAKLVDTVRSGTVARVELPPSAVENPVHAKVTFHF